MHTEKAFVVTGATSGIGLAITLGLADAGRKVILVGRNESLLADATGRARGRAASPVQIQAYCADLGTLAGARRAAADLGAMEAIGVVIHCAGLWPTEKRITADGFEESFVVNHLAPMILNQTLVPLLQHNGSGRIVQVSAGLALKGKIDLERDPAGESFHPLRTYASTKLWNLLTTLELARKVEGTGLTVNAIHPGVVRTKLGDLPGALGILLRLVKRFWMTPEQGARGPLHLALSPEVASQNGVFYNQFDPMPLGQVAADQKLARAAVNKTAALLGVHGQASA